MIRKVGAWVVLGLAAAACASSRGVPPPPPPPPPGFDAPGNPPPPASYHPMVRCGPTEACAPKEKSLHRQYYDVHHRRYYYYDPMKRRYFWEDGQPKT